MAITTNSITVVRPPAEGDEWCISLYSADFSGGEDLLAATSGKCHYVRKIQLFTQSVTDVTVTIGSAQGTDVTTAYLGPIPMPDAGGSTVIDFGPDHAMKIASGTALSIDTSAACPAAVLVWGKTAT